MKKLLQIVLWVVGGILVGFGAILPGLSGGAFCAAFGFYQPIIEVLSSPIKAIKKYWFMFIFVGIGGLIGVVGLSKLVLVLIEWNPLVVYSAFSGLVLGTVPELFADAGKKGRSKASFISLGVCFTVLLALLLWMLLGISFSVKPGVLGFMLCGVLWALSIIVPGLSSSNFIMLFGLYEPMSDGIGNLDLAVLLPMGITMLVALFALSHPMKKALNRFYSVVTHGVIGTVLATAVMILLVPYTESGLSFHWIDLPIMLGCAACGAVAAYFFTLLCGRIKRANGIDE